MNNIIKFTPLSKYTDQTTSLHYIDDFDMKRKGLNKWFFIG